MKELSLCMFVASVYYPFLDGEELPSYQVAKLGFFQSPSLIDIANETNLHS